jgi:hypothetical protein
MIRLLAVLALLVLAGCGAERTWAPEVEVQRALYRVEGPAKLTLFTVISTRSGSGAHSALMVSGDHRALFDPAGTFYHPAAPERNDVHFGITENVLKVYIDYHARETFDVRIQDVTVSPEVARMAMREIQNYGAVPKAHCNVAVTAILSRLPGFEDVPRGYFPLPTAEWFSELPGVTDRLVTDDDADANHGVLLRAAERVLPQEIR